MGFAVSKPLTVPASQWWPALRGELPRMDGKVVAVTGCTGGMGLVTARTCGELGAKVVMLNRKSPRAEAAFKTLKESGLNVTHVDCDLASFASVRVAAVQLQSTCPEGIDVLCNNAGVMGMANIGTGDGFCIQMQCNHLSHFLLVGEVWPLLQKAAARSGEARVVNHSSGARSKPAGPLKAKYLQQNGGNLGSDWWPLSKWTRYQQSKLANVLFTYALHEKAQANGDKVKIMVAHPGPTLTNLQMTTAQSGSTGWLDTWILNSTMNRAHSEEDGACGLVRCCCLPDVASGAFWGPPADGGEPVLLPAERNVEGEVMLWAESVSATGCEYP